MKKYHTLAELIIDYRETKKLSQLDVAMPLNVDEPTVSAQWLNRSFEKEDPKICTLIIDQPGYFTSYMVVLKLVFGYFKENNFENSVFSSIQGWGRTLSVRKKVSLKSVWENETRQYSLEGSFD